GFKDVEGTQIVVFYPDGGVSPVQEKQMLTTNGKNTFVAAVKGNFDECQSAVKDIFGSTELRDKLNENSMKFSSANSINWGRLLPQIVYYFWSYLQAIKQDSIVAGENINLVVPTGNFGNILAAYYAKKMGLPVANLICASNKNNILSDFFEKGEYDTNRNFYLTMSPSMDILISSNFERFLYEASGRDAEKINSWYADLSLKGSFTVDPDVLKVCNDNIKAGWADEESVMRVIKSFYLEKNYLLDPHTAVGMKVYEDYRNSTGDNTYTVLASTASPFKFADSVLKAIRGGNNIGSWESIGKLNEITGWKIPSALQDLFSKPIMDVHRCKPENISEYLINKFIK
ncbi:MAG: threonine synthase, partial [Eubacteriales bacterium]